MFSPFKIGNVRLLFGGQTVSTIGDALYAVALPWLILSNGGSSQELGVVLTAYGLPRVGSVLLGGWLSDRLHPRRVMLIADTVRAVLVGILALLAFWRAANVWELSTVAVFLGTFEGLFLASSSAMLPALLSDEDLQAGNALNFASAQATNLVGSAIAGVVVATLNSGAALATDALTFVASAISLALMRVSSGATSGRTGEALGAQTESEDQVSGTARGEEQISLGRFLRTSRVMQVMLAVSLAANMYTGGLLEVALPTLIHGPLNGGASGYGTILAAFGGGALLGGMLAGMLGGLQRKGLLALLAELIMAVVVALIPYGGIVGTFLCMLVYGLINSASNVLFVTLLQRHIPRHLMGRVMGLLLFTSLGTYPLSVALGGVLTRLLGPVVLFPFSGLTLFLAVLFGITQRELREL
jgi:MFS family permease